jgi:hypothetical protein
VWARGLRVRISRPSHQLCPLCCRNKSSLDNKHTSTQASKPTPAAGLQAVPGQWCAPRPRHCATAFSRNVWCRLLSVRDDVDRTEESVVVLPFVALFVLLRTFITNFHLVLVAIRSAPSQVVSRACLACPPPFKAPQGSTVHPGLTSHQAASNTLIIPFHVSPAQFPTASPHSLNKHHLPIGQSQNGHISSCLVLTGEESSKDGPEALPCRGIRQASPWPGSPLWVC